MVNPNRFYTYAYLREDKTPYYIGKGQKRRAYQNTGKPCATPKDKSRIIYLKQNLIEEEALKHEIYMINIFGRKDNQTGILRNKTNGGEGVSGYIVSDEMKLKLSIINTGKKLSKETKNKMSQSGKNISEETRRKLSEIRKGRPCSEETRRKISESKKNPSEETRRKIREAKKDVKWWNDECGNTKFAEKCPGDSWVLGRGKLLKNLKC